jgi:eukaryotic-like serine/threonine-protein kinase
VSFAIEGYEELRELGRGAAGRVVLARHEATGTPVAIKYLDPDVDFLTGFRAEARLLSTLDSDDIVRLYEYVEEPAGAGIVMELVNGATLRAILAEGPLSPEASLVLLRGALAGLSAAHRAGVTHRDFKPENVLVDETGASKLADFGIAARHGRLVASAGTPSYLAPELWAEDTAAGPAGDIYAATASFVECLTGAPPYPGPDLAALRLQHANAPIPQDGLPEPVRALVRHGLAKRPDQRPEDAASFLAELERAAGDGYGADWQERGRKHLARRAALLALLFPLGAPLLGGSAVATTILGRLALPALGAVLVIALAGGAVVVTRPTSGNQTPTAVGSPDSPRPLTSPRPADSASAGTSPSTAPSTAAPSTPAGNAGGGPTTHPPASAAPHTTAPHTTAPAPAPSTPPANPIVSLGIKQFVYGNGGVGPDVDTLVVLTTTTTGPVTVKLVYKHLGGVGETATHTLTLSGSTSYSKTDTLDVSSWCNGTGVSVTATVTSTSDTGGPVTKTVTPGYPC